MEAWDGSWVWQSVGCQSNHDILGFHLRSQLQIQTSYSNITEEEIEMFRKDEDRKRKQKMTSVFTVYI